MSKHIERLKKQLMEFSEVVNSFASEAVQVRIVDRLLDTMIESERADSDTDGFTGRAAKRSGNTEQYQSARRGKKPGATKILNQLLTTDFFETPHSILEIADYCHDNFESNFKTSELSGILLKFAKENKLRRERSNENNGFEYVKAD